MSQCFVYVHILYILIWLLMRPIPGFGEILGKHTPSSGGTTVLGGKFPQTAVMYNHFLKPGKPLLMKGALGENYSAFDDWTDDYIKEKFWDDVITIWTDDSPESSALTMSLFIDLYQTLGYTVSDYMPEKMKAETLVPPVLQCGGIQDNLHSPGLFFSDGGDKTLLHYNDIDLLTCLLDGSQEFVLFDKLHKDLIEEAGWVSEGGYSQVDVEAVDKQRFPSLYSAPWHKATLMKGDCLLVPYGWYQHVSTPLGRTLAIQFKFSHLWWLDKADCDNRDKNETYKPVTEFKLLDGIGELRTALLAPFSNSTSVTMEMFKKNVDCGSVQLTEQFWSSIDRNSDGTLSWPELYSFDMNYIQNRFHSCYRNLQKQKTSHRLVFKSWSGTTRERVMRERRKAAAAKKKLKTIDDLHNRQKQMNIKLGDRGAGKMDKDFKESSTAEEDKKRKDEDKAGKHRHEEF